jgi:hypothetical protein
VSADTLDTAPQVHATTLTGPSARLAPHSATLPPAESRIRAGVSLSTTTLVPVPDESVAAQVAQVVEARSATGSLWRPTTLTKVSWRTAD